MLFSLLKDLIEATEVVSLVMDFTDDVSWSGLFKT